eukprot:6187042-Pleurochrysis_carterae.AAC.2
MRTHAHAHRREHTRMHVPVDKNARAHTRTQTHLALTSPPAELPSAKSPFFHSLDVCPRLCHNAVRSRARRRPATSARARCCVRRAACADATLSAGRARRAPSAYCIAACSVESA